MIKNTISRQISDRRATSFAPVVRLAMTAISVLKTALKLALVHRLRSLAFVCFFPLLFFFFFFPYISDLNL